MKITLENEKNKDVTNNYKMNIRNPLKTLKNSYQRVSNSLEEIIKSFKKGLASRLMIEKSENGYKVELYDVKNRLLKTYCLNRDELNSLYQNLK